MDFIQIWYKGALLVDLNLISFGVIPEWFGFHGNQLLKNFVILPCQDDKTRTTLCISITFDMGGTSWVEANGISFWR